MPTHFNSAATKMRPVAPAGPLQITGILDRATHGPDSHVAPLAKACVVVDPIQLTQSYPGLFNSGWKPTARDDAYGLYVDDTLVTISLEHGMAWVIEATYPVTGRHPAVLGVGCALVVTRSPMAAAQLAKLCTPTPVPPFEWIPYW